MADSPDPWNLALQLLAVGVCAFVVSGGLWMLAEIVADAFAAEEDDDA